MMEDKKMQEKEVAVVDALAEDQQAIVPVIGSSIESLATLPVAERRAALKVLTSYVGAETVQVDDYLGVVLEVVGCVKHPATVKDNQTGETVEMERVVFKLKDGKCIGLMSKAASDFVEQFLFPLFGQGDFLDENKQPFVVPIVIRQIRTRHGFRTYSFQVV